ncbi:MAG: hypothetical protein KDA84_29480, partial [Planctomycetaceae bacterium]|nr:hypothetical protein [Planctomycetaceae bacterium]
PPQPTFAQPSKSEETAHVPQTKTQPLDAIDEFAKREEEATNALKLAEKMWKIKPTAAESWYRKVVEKYPNTEAAQHASDWLKRQGHEP